MVHFFQTNAFSSIVSTVTLSSFGVYYKQGVHNSSFYIFSVYLDPNLVMYPGKMPRKYVLDTVLHGLAISTGIDFKLNSISNHIDFVLNGNGCYISIHL